MFDTFDCWEQVYVLVAILSVVAVAWVVLSGRPKMRRRF